MGVTLKEIQIIGALWFHPPLQRPVGAQVQAHCRSQPQCESADLQQHHH